MKKISLKGFLASEVLTKKQLKEIVGGASGSGQCALGSGPIPCSGNCQRPGGGAGKCTMYSGQCQCR